MDSFRVRPGDIQSREDLRKIPPSAKEELRQAGLTALISQEYHSSELLSSKTTGSTGVPLEVFKSPVENWIHLLIRLRSMRYFGYHSRLKTMKISFDKPRPIIWQWLSFLGFYRQSVVPMTLPPAQIALRVLERRPDVVLGIPTILALVAGEIHSRNPTFRLPFAVTGAELLTPGLKRQIETVFGRVFNTYASIETQHPIAFDCLTEPCMHVNDQAVILEILDEDGEPVKEGETGEVVLTSLHSFSMPIIRYRMGDLAIAGPSDCPCGYPGTVIRSLEGRRSDYFLLPNGEKFLAIGAAHVIQKLADWILQYELVQESITDVQLRIVPISSPSEDEKLRLLEAVEGCFGGEVEVTIRLVPNLESGPGGKFRVIRTRLGSPYD